MQRHMRVLTALAALAATLAGPSSARAESADLCALLAPELPPILGPHSGSPQAPIGPTSCVVTSERRDLTVTFMSHGEGTGSAANLAGVRASQAHSDNTTLADEPSLGPGAYSATSGEGRTIEFRTFRGHQMLTFMLHADEPLKPEQREAVRTAFSRILTRL